VCFHKVFIIRSTKQIIKQNEQNTCSEALIMCETPFNTKVQITLVKLALQV
jgi:hypothetical protein